MKTIACYALHYGLEYLPWSIRSIQDAVDEIYVFYADRPSYGFSQGAKCPESEGELQEAAHRFLHKKLYWHKGTWTGEGAHRNSFIEKAKEIHADMILVVDSDELWAPGAAEKALKSAWDQNKAGRWLCNFQNFWRSFDWEIRDSFKPIRIVDMRFSLEQDAYLDNEPVFHYGYAQSLEIMKYKWTCHGHQAELRKNWFSEKFMVWSPETNTPGDLHPTVNNLWDKAYEVSSYVKEVNKQLLFDHPYYGKSIIA